MMPDAATKLLDDFRSLPASVERSRTFIEIAGYPHYENACSNILAFFMDPSGAHGFGTLVLDALMSVGQGNKFDAVIGGNVSVEREVNTDNGRIDVLITSDDHAVLVENKIHASANNPFDDYATYLERVANGRAKHKFLLTLYPTNEGSAWGFTNLTHEELVHRIRSLLGLYVSNADARYLTMFLDFLNTLENLQEGSRMNHEFVKLLSERKEEAESFFAELMGFRDELRKKVRDLGALINLEEYQHVKQFMWRGKGWLSDILIHDIRVSEDAVVRIDATVGPQGWGIYIWQLNQRGDRSRLKDLLQRANVPFETGQGKGFAYPKRFAWSCSSRSSRQARRESGARLMISLQLAGLLYRKRRAEAR